MIENSKKLQIDLIKFFNERNLSPEESLNFLCCFLLAHIYGTLNITEKEDIIDFLNLDERLEFLKNFYKK